MTGAVGQPAPINVRSRLPLTLMQEALTFQVPTTLPPHAVTFEQEAPAAPPIEPASPPLPEVLEAPEAPPLLVIAPPLLAIAPPLLPGVPALPAVPFEPPAHAPEITATAAAITKAADRIFIEWFLSKGSVGG